jgi:hypothetical protein
MNYTLINVLGILCLFSLLVWIGLRRKPRPFTPIVRESQDKGTFPLPDGLPDPVSRFYREIYGKNVPIIHSFVLTGRGQIRFKGIALPARLRFTHDAGKGYRHYIETTFWRKPVMKVNEHFLDGHSRLVLPFGVVENEPQVDEAANLGMWSETMMFPGVFLSTAGVSWEAIDKTLARLIVPFQDKQDTFKVSFNPTTGLIEKMEALRWKNAGDEQKVRWQAQVGEWGEVKGWKMPVLFAAQWMDEPSPWLTARIEDVLWNVDVSEYIQQVGP